jgi:hypothetical protein
MYRAISSKKIFGALVNKWHQQSCLSLVKMSDSKNQCFVAKSTRYKLVKMQLSSRFVGLNGILNRLTRGKRVKLDSPSQRMLHACKTLNGNKLSARSLS